MASAAERVVELIRSIRPHAIVISTSIALALGGALRVGAFAQIPVIALSKGDDALAVDAERMGVGASPARRTGGSGESSPFGFLAHGDLPAA
jgi:hypothetical protein